jgi:hypothetical protein
MTSKERFQEKLREGEQLEQNVVLPFLRDWFGNWLIHPFCQDARRDIAPSFEIRSERLSVPDFQLRRKNTTIWVDAKKKNQTLGRVKGFECKPLVTIEPRHLANYRKLQEITGDEIYLLFGIDLGLSKKLYWKNINDIVANVWFNNSHSNFINTEYPCYYMDAASQVGTF